MSPAILIGKSWSACWLVLAITMIGLVSGCAAGAWIESPSEAELPIDPPARGYPTAIGEPGSPAAARVAQINDGPPLPSQEPPASVTSAAPADKSVLVTSTAGSPGPTTPVSRPNPEQRPGHIPSPPVTALAVIPPHLRTRQPVTRTATSPAAPIPAEAPLTPIEPTPVEPPIKQGVVTASLTDEVDPQVEPTDSAASSKSTLESARSEFIAALEVEIRERREANPKDEELPRLEQDLRLAYLVADRLDDAVTVIESLDESQREAYKQLMFGLGVWLSPDESRRAPLRTAKVLHSLRDATTELSAGSKLELRRLAFCERVESFGAFTEFPRNEFQPKQQVILYAEVDNFTAERKSSTIFETELQGSYQILDSSGQIVADKKLETDKGLCRNHRRDYFLAYRLYMPESIPPGRYRLELTIEDQKARNKYPGRKLGDGVIEFTIRQ